MKKFLNDPGHYVQEAVQGLVLAHPDTFRSVDTARRVIARRQAKDAGKVGVVSGGGFGHLPLFAGYVGTGLLDACAVGDVFAGPALDTVSCTIDEADRGGGVLAIVGNYGGDKMAFAMAGELAAAGGVPVETVIVNDDVASAAPAEKEKRRGVAGLVLVYKVAGAAAEAGWPLERVAKLSRKAVDRCRSIGAALTGCAVPTRGRPAFELEDGTIEMGMGIHGEQGVWRGPIRNADTLADEMLERVLEDLGPLRGSRVALLCNSLGATPIEELYILYRRFCEQLDRMGVTVARPLVGHYATSMEMAGASISVLLLDDELEDLIQAPAASPFWRV